MRTVPVRPPYLERHRQHLHPTTPARRHDRRGSPHYCPRRPTVPKPSTPGGIRVAVGCRWFGTALEAHADSSSYRFFPREAVHVDNHCYCPKCKRPGLTRPAVHHTAARTAPAPGGSCESCSGWLELLKKRTDRVRAVLVYTRSNAMWCKVDTLEAEICRLRRADKMKNLVMIHSIVNWPNIQVLASLQVFLPFFKAWCSHAHILWK